MGAMSSRSSSPYRTAPSTSTYRTAPSSSRRSRSRRSASITSSSASTAYPDTLYSQSTVPDYETYYAPTNQQYIYTTYTYPSMPGEYPLYYDSWYGEDVYDDVWRYDRSVRPAVRRSSVGVRYPEGAAGYDDIDLRRARQKPRPLPGGPIPGGPIPGGPIPGGPRRRRQSVAGEMVPRDYDYEYEYDEYDGDEVVVYDESGRRRRTKHRRPPRGYIDRETSAVSGEDVVWVPAPPPPPPLRVRRPIANSGWRRTWDQAWDQYGWSQWAGTEDWNYRPEVWICGLLFIILMLFITE